MVGLYATNTLKEREIAIATESNAQSLRNQREESETNLRSAMFRELVGPLLQSETEQLKAGGDTDLPRSQRLALLAETPPGAPWEADLQRTIEQAERDGYVTTLLGRRRPVPEIRTRNRQTRALGERLAVNSVMQGTAADVIKVATSGGVLSPRDKPTHAHLRPAELEVLVEEATAAGMFVMAHAQARDGIINTALETRRSLDTVAPVPLRPLLDEAVDQRPLDPQARPQRPRIQRRDRGQPRAQDDGSS